MPVLATGGRPPGRSAEPDADDDSNDWGSLVQRAEAYAHADDADEEEDDRDSAVSLHSGGGTGRRGRGAHYVPAKWGAADVDGHASLPSAAGSVISLAKLPLAKLGAGSGPVSPNSCSSEAFLPSPGHPRDVHVHRSMSDPGFPIGWSTDREPPFSAYGPAFPMPTQSRSAALAVADAPAISDLLLPSLTGYFAHFHRLFPLLHRPTFERAFRSGASAYGNKRPLALTYAAAAVGAAEIEDVPDAQKIAYTRWCCNRARDLLLAQGAADLESAQALCLLMDVMLRAGEPASMLPLVQRAALIVDKLYLSMPPGFPPDAESWAIREMVLRLRIYVAAYDVGTASTTGKPTIGHYWHAHKFPIPATEAEFDSPDPEAAHMTAEARYDAGLEPTVDFGKSDYASISSAMRILAGAPFGGGGSVLSMLHLANYASHIRDSLLSSAPGPSGTDRRHKTAVQSALWDATTGALPPDICKGLARGDAGPLLRGWKAYFPDPAHAHAALQSFLLAKRAAIEVFARSGFVAAAVSRCSRFVRTLDSTIKHDPALPYCHSGLASPAAAVGRMLIDEARQLQDHPGPFETPEERTERERRKEELIMQARICCRVLGRLGAVYGLNLRQAAKGYHAEMVAAGWASATCPSASLNDLSEEEAEFRSDVGSHGHTEEFGGSTVLFAEEKMARGVVGAA